MINSHAFRANCSSVLRAECQHLLTQVDKFRSRRPAFAPWLPCPMVFGLVVGSIVFSVMSVVYLLFHHFVSGDTDPLNEITILITAVIMLVVVTWLMYIREICHFEHGEVGDKFYELLASKAKVFPDLALAIDGFEHLSVFNARAVLIKLINRLEDEQFSVINPPRNSNSRARFQEISLSDKSTLGESS